MRGVRRADLTFRRGEAKKRRPRSRTSTERFGFCSRAADLARRWHDLMDVNAGTIATGEKTIEEVGWEMFRLMLEVASGRKKTWAEHWKPHNSLVLFNPAPVT